MRSGRVMILSSSDHASGSLEMGKVGRLPSGFEKFEEFVYYWDVDTSDVRWTRRAAAGYDEILRFYDALTPRMEEEATVYRAISTPRNVGGCRLPLSPAPCPDAGGDCRRTPSGVACRRVNPTKRGGWSSDINWVFPNWHIQITASRFWTHEFWPRTHNSSSWEARFYQPKVTTVRERLQLEHFTATIADAFLEDLANIESTQSGMECGAKSFVYLHESEILIRHPLEKVQKWTHAACVDEALR
ncbi:MAG: hypothetical protein COC10_01430 [Sphingobium sp.]|nr:MAG: hypothetical protein COC10_01430 [Sphingobium sp.]